jgi:hypothetical protein
MKKFKCLIVVFLIMLFSNFAYAVVPTSTQALASVGTLGNMLKWTITITVTDAGDANIAPTAMTPAIFAKVAGWYLYQVSPQAAADGFKNNIWDFNLTVLGNATTNLLGGVCDDLSNTLTKKVIVPDAFAIDEKLYFDTDDNDEVGVVSIDVIFVR